MSNIKCKLHRLCRVKVKLLLLLKQDHKLQLEESPCLFIPTQLQYKRVLDRSCLCALPMHRMEVSRSFEWMF